MSLGLSAGATARIPPANSFTASGVYDNSEYPAVDTVYTVPAGQKLYIEGCSFSSTSGAQPITRVDATQVLLCIVPIDETISFAGAPIIQVDGGESLKTVAASGGESYYWNYWGYIL